MRVDMLLIVIVDTTLRSIQYQVDFVVYTAIYLFYSYYAPFLFYSYYAPLFSLTTFFFPFLSLNIHLYIMCGTQSHS